MSANWLEVLRLTCETTTKAAVARQLGVSPAMVGLALKGEYKGNMTRLQTLVEGSLMSQTVTCPVMGEMPKHKCQEHQDRDPKFATANPFKAQLYIACRSGCPHSKLAREY
jgi:hypothetical protein